MASHRVFDHRLPRAAALRIQRRLLLQGTPSMACPFGGVNVHWTFTITPPHPWRGARRRESSLNSREIPASPNWAMRAWNLWH